MNLSNFDITTKIVFFLGIVVLIIPLVFYFFRRKKIRNPEKTLHPAIHSARDIPQPAKKESSSMVTHDTEKRRGHGSDIQHGDIITIDRAKVEKRDDVSPDVEERSKQESAERLELEKQKREAEEESRAKQESFRKKYRISIAHPKYLSKRYSSLFIVQIYSPDMRAKVTRTLELGFENDKIEEHIQDSDLITGQEIRLRFSCSVIAFSEPVIKKLDKSINLTNFSAKPDDHCFPGPHTVILSISDAKTQFEYQSISFIVQVTDYAFDHVSRPVISRALSLSIGVGSLIMFILTLLGQIDTTFGLTSGTVAGMLASGVYARFISLYQKPKTAVIP